MTISTATRTSTQTRIEGMKPIARTPLRVIRTAIFRVAILALIVGPILAGSVAAAEWPILGLGSKFAARAALASQAQGKYEAFHRAMMAHSGAIDETSRLEVARTVGLDVERLKREMADAAFAAELDRNFTLAGTLRINGTPSFVIGEEIVRGLVDLATLQQHIATARAEPGG